MRTWFTVILCFTLILITGCTDNSNSSPTEKDQVEQVKSEKTAQMESHLKTENIIYGPAGPIYKIDVTYDDKKHQISGTMHVSFVNNLDKTLEHIYFNLWPNAKEFKSGGVQVDNVQFNNKPVKFDVKKTKLNVSGLSLKTDEEATIKMDFTVTIPEMKNRFGWYDTNVSLGNWFPILAVYDNEGWNLDTYFAGGESFYSLTSDFDVTLKTNKGQMIATTGQSLGKVTMEDGLAIHHFKAKNVRDFAIVMNSAFNQSTFNENGIKINVFYEEENKEYAKYMMDTARYSLSLYGKLFGKYPWPELDIIGMPINVGLGMEYPQLVMISLKSDEEKEKYAIYHTTEHEIAHQWFYGAVGNNQYDEPWLDESFASFASYIALHDKKPNFKWVRAIGKKYYHLTSPASTFLKHKEDDGLAMYGDVIYDYGAKALNELRKKLGDDAFYKGMQAYFEEMKFKVATTADFIRIMEQSSGEDLSKFFKDHRVYLDDTR
ncbi:M1 family metallopeptidase [Virgibacillus necropolis]|uniref:M1 family metallopeptidase n=1 Tax=Virgibacillus necropolis TaxID=163877 RepID=UPI0038500A53